MLPALLAAARFGLPLLGGMLPSLIDSMQSGKSPEEVAAAVKPHYDALIKQGMTPDQAHAALADEMKQAAEPEHHPILDLVLGALGAYGGSKLAGKLAVPSSAFPTKGKVSAPASAQAAKVSQPSGMTSKSTIENTPSDPLPASAGDKNPASQPYSGVGKTSVPGTPSSGSTLGRIVHDDDPEWQATPTEEVLANIRSLHPTPTGEFDPMGETQEMLPNTPRTELGGQTTLSNVPMNRTGTDTLAGMDIPTSAFPTMGMATTRQIDPLRDPNALTRQMDWSGGHAPTEMFRTLPADLLTEGLPHMSPQERAQAMRARNARRLGGMAGPAMQRDGD